MCFAGKASILAQRNKYYASVVEGRKPKRLSRQILKDRCWFKQNLYVGRNKSPRKINWIQGRKIKTQTFRYYSLHEERRFQICNRFTSIQIIKLEEDNFAIHWTQFSWTKQSNKRLAEGSVPLLLLLWSWIHSFPTPAFWSIIHISVFNGNQPCKL